MNQKIKTDGVLFDLDGTLWDASVPVAAGFQQAIDGHPEVKEAMTPEIMRANMGRLLDEILHHTYPYLTEEQVQSVLKDYLALGCGYIAEAGGRLFDGLEATLKTLSARFPLFIVSNCQAGYIEAFFQAHGLQRYFKDYEHPGRTGKPKAENNRLLVARNHLQHPVYVGDTMGDANAAREAGIPFIWASYGFGDVPQALRAAKIQAVTELAGLLEPA